MSTDPIADLLTQIRNGYMAKKTNVQTPLSKMKLRILDILKKEDYILDFEKKEKQIDITLKYEKKQAPFSKIVRISKPGCRIYTKTRKILPVQSGFGMAIISTPQGLMTEKEAKKKRLGGEIICKIW